MINVLICDDEQISVRENKCIIEELLCKMGVEFSLHCYNDVNITEEMIRSIDLAILDIDFKNERSTGIMLAKKIQEVNKWIAVVFVTAHSEYALDAFRLQVLGYLEKPINKVHLEIVIRKVLVYLKGRGLETATFEFLHDRKKVMLQQRNIVYIERVNRKIRIETSKSHYEINESINTVESRLMDFFLKINSGTFVNMYCVAEIVNCNIYLSNGLSFRIARNRMSEVKEKYFLFTNKS